MGNKSGRKQVLTQRKNISVNVEQYQKDYLDSLDIEMSQFVRDCLDNFIRNNETPREILIRQKQDLEDKMDEMKVQISMIDLQLNQMDKKEKMVELEELEVEEFESKRKAYILDCRATIMKGQNTYNSMWLKHLREVWKFPTNEEALRYVCEEWIEAGASEYRVKKFLRLS